MVPSMQQGTSGSSNDESRGEDRALSPLVTALSECGVREGALVGETPLTGLRVDEQSALILSFVAAHGPVSVSLRRPGASPRYQHAEGLDVSYSNRSADDANHARALADLIIQAMKERPGAGKAVHDALEILAARPIERAPQAPQPTRSPEGPPKAQAASPYEVRANLPPPDPALRAPDDQPFMTWLTFDLKDAERYSDVLRQIYRYEVCGIIVRGVYSREDMARIVAAVGAGAARRIPTVDARPSDEAKAVDAGTEHAHVVGRGLESTPDLPTYLKSASAFRQEISELFEREQVPPFEETVSAAFRRLAGGRSVESPKADDGRQYIPGTLRIFPPGSEIPTHCGNVMLRRPGYKDFSTRVDTLDQLSYFLTVQDATDGGELAVYEAQYLAHEVPDGPESLGRVAQSRWTAYRPGPGDLLIFDGGRYFHRVTVVGGSRTRITMGGFLMFDRSGETIFYWG